MSLGLPPLANIFAYRDPDPTVLATVERALLASSPVPRLWHPPGGWVGAYWPLPGSVGRWGPVDQDDLVVFEGEDLLLPQGAVGSTERDRLMALVVRTPDDLDHLDGDFGLAHFGTDGSLTAVRSAGGIVPVYVWGDGQRMAIGTRLDHFVQHLPAPLTPDALAHASWLFGGDRIPSPRSFLQGVSLVPRGCYATLRPDRPVTLRRYWDPRPDELPLPTEESTREHAQDLRRLLLAHLSRHLDPGGANLLTLSGGMDSSSLAYLAAGTLGFGISTLTLITTDPVGQQHERSYIDPLLEELRVKDAQFVAADGPALLSLYEGGQPSAFPIIHPALRLLPDVVDRRPVRVLFGGEWADEVCGSGATVPDWATHTSLWDLVSGRAPRWQGRKDLGRWVKWRGRRLLGRPFSTWPERLTDAVRAEVQEEYRQAAADAARDARADPRPLAGLAVRLDQDGFLAMNWEAASRLGVRRIVPFGTRELQQLAFRCHPHEQLGPGTKKVLRSALAQDVPDRHLSRHDKGSLFVIPPGPVWPTPASSSGVDPLWLCDESWLRRLPCETDLISAVAMRILVSSRV